MTEREYLDVRELSNLIAISNLLRDIVPENSESISIEDYRTISESINNWKQKLFNKMDDND